LGRQPGELFMTVLQLQRHMQTVEEIMQDGQHPTGITEWDAE
jgi:fructose-1,6-bisphosphatase/sedoheptulose 1,7-bisphosphatase-like protein